MSGVVPFLSPALALGQLVFGKKAPEPPKAQPIVQQRPNSEVADALSLRRGTQENKRSGRRGAEAGGGAKTTLGS